MATLSTYEDAYVERDIERLKKLGVVPYIAEAIFDKVDIFKVEALVLARHCPVDLALQIARF